MTETTPAPPESAPTLDLGRRLFARQARAESRLSPWTRRDLAGKAIVRELRFAQHIARRVYGRGAPGVTFEGPLSPNAPRGAARFSEKVAERNTLADVARKYAPADDAEAGEAGPRTAANAPLPLAGAGAPGGEGGAFKNAGPAISAAEALQRLAVTRPDLDPDASPFAKMFKAATGSAQPSESTLQRASDSARRVVETFQRGGPRPRADATSAPAPIQPRVERPPSPIQRRVDPSAAAAPVPPPVTPPPERPPATPSSRALRRFAKVEEVVPPNFTPPSDDFGDDLPEPGGPAIQRALPPVPGDAMPLARRPEAPSPPDRASVTVAQAKRPAPPSAPAPKRAARPAPAPARLQRRTAAPAARPAVLPAPGARPSAQVDQGVEPQAEPQRPAADARGEQAERPIDAPSERQTPRPSSSIQRQPEGTPGMPPAAGDRQRTSNTSTIGGPVSPPQEGQAAELPDTAPAPPGVPIQPETTEASSGDLPLARLGRPESPPADVVQRTPAAGVTPASKSSPTPREPAAAPLDDLPGPRPAAREVPEDASLGAPVQRKPDEPSTAASARDVDSAPQLPAQIQRASSEGQTADLPVARPPVSVTEHAPEVGTPPAPADLPAASPLQHAVDKPPAPIQRQPIADRAADLPLAQPSQLPPAGLEATPTQRQATEDRAKELPLVRPPEPALIPPAAVEPPPVVQRGPIDDASRDLPLARPAEPVTAPPPPAAVIQRASIDDAAIDLPLVRPPEPAPLAAAALSPAVTVQRAPVEDTAKEMPLARPTEPGAPPPQAPGGRQPATDEAGEQPRGRPSEPPAAAPGQPKIRETRADSPPLARPHEPTSTPPAPIQRQPSEAQPPNLPLARWPASESPPAGEPSPRAQLPVSPSDGTPELPPIRPRPSALNLARRAVQRMLGDEPLPKPATAPVQGQPQMGGSSLPKSGQGGTAAQIARREQNPGTEFALRHVPSTVIAPEEPGPGASSTPTSEVKTSAGVERPLPIPAKIQRARSAKPVMARTGSDAPEMRRTAAWDEQLPLVVPLLAAQSQSAARQIQRVETPGPSGASATRVAPQKNVRRTVDRSSSGDSTLPAPNVGPYPPTPEQPSPAKGNEPDFNYDLLAQRVYPFIRRLLAFERERERGS